MSSFSVDVPLSTAIADLDEAIRLLLERELGRHGFEGVQIAFDAPARDWSAKLTGPAVDLFLYDLREAADRAELTPTEQRADGRATVIAPPLRLELSYAVTAWTKTVEDEHRLLSQLVAILHSYRHLPPELLGGQLAANPRLREAETSVGRPREGKADFWTSVGGQYKASIDFAVILTIDSGASASRGPEVRTQTIRGRLAEGRQDGVVELHRFGGTVHDSAGAPVANAWVALPDSGRWTATDQQGHFVLNRVRAGEQSLVVRALSGQEVVTTVTVPGHRGDIVVGEPGRVTRPRRRDGKR
jgi:Pvc16 N-terminal domain/Carboxypeptidase regulatory-like domain